MGKGKHKKATPFEANWYIYFAVIISGASVLAIEILGTRIIGPFYGVSLFLWSALISVTLAALSLGYALGGQLADKGPRLSRFCALLAAAGVWIVLIPWIKHPALVLAEPLGLRFAVLFAAFVLFFPPLTLLGMVGPYAIRMKSTTIDEVGRPAHRKAVDLTDHGLRTVPDLHEALDVAVHELVVAHGVPGAGARLDARCVVGARPAPCAAAPRACRRTPRAAC